MMTCKTFSYLVAKTFSGQVPSLEMFQNKHVLLKRSRQSQKNEQSWDFLLKCCRLKSCNTCQFSPKVTFKKIWQDWDCSIHCIKMKFPLRISPVNVTKSAVSFLRIWSYLLEKSLMENFTSFAVIVFMASFG